MGKLKKLKLIQDKLYSKHDGFDQNNGRMSSEEEFEEDSDSTLNSEDLSIDGDMNNGEAESTNTDYLSSEEEEPVDDDGIMNQNLVQDIATSRKQNSSLNNGVSNNMNNFKFQDPPSPTLEENNGNVSDSFEQIDNLEELDVS